MTAVAALSALDADVDHSLQAAVEAAAAHPPAEGGGESGEVDDVQPAAADTFVLYLDSHGAVVSNPSRIRLTGLPDPAAVAALAGGASSDWRTVTSGLLSVRLLTLSLPAGEASAASYVQGGFVLTLHDLQSRSLVAAILGTAAVGLLAGAIVATILTRRALLPVRRAMAAQRRFVADASHELRTPAAIIRADAEVLDREGHVAAPGKPLLEDIVEESARLGRLVGDLLTLATAERGELQLHAAAFDLADLVHQVVGRMTPMAATQGVILSLDAPGTVPVVADADRITQAVVVLVDNAIGHAPAGSAVEVCVRLGDAHLARVEVSDHGRGVSAADRDRIFEPFTRGPRTERPRRGAGLGLAIAREIVAAHHGTVGVSDVPGGGARFVLELPASA